MNCNDDWCLAPIWKDLGYVSASITTYFLNWCEITCNPTWKLISQRWWFHRWVLNGRWLPRESMNQVSNEWLVLVDLNIKSCVCVCVSICFDCRPLLFKWSVRTRQSGTRVSHFTESFLNFCSSWAACIGNPIPPHPVKIPIFTGQLLSYRRFNGLQF